jgi:hypothetical protein
VRRVVVLAGLFLSLALSVRVEARHPRPASRQSPHEEIVAIARVGTEPKRTTHENGRAFEEFDVVILSVRPADEGAGEGPRPTDVDRTSSVHVVHDLSCGGQWVALAPGDRVDLKGEYVHPPKGHDLIHFTHPADASCSGEPHADGWIRRIADPGGAPGRTPTSS